MDEVRLEQQVASVERGIAFLKQEHLAMLTGLQLEITRLKRRCHGQSVYLLISIPQPQVSQPLLSVVVIELNCELDSSFPDRSTEGTTLHVSAVKKEN